MASTAVVTQRASGLASGAHPVTTFPNSHLAVPRSPAGYSKPFNVKAIDQLRQAVREENWERHYETRATSICMRSEWSASSDRCSQLQFIASKMQARRVLEIGSFCGVGALALAEAVPEDGVVQVLELDGLVVRFGQKYQKRSPVGHKIKHMVGPAKDSLERLADGAGEGSMPAFDLVMIDADKEGMRHYFDTVCNSPGLLAEGGVVCVDLTPFKGQIPARYEKFGFPHRWQAESGIEAIEALKAYVEESAELVAHEIGSLLIVQRIQRQRTI